MYTTLVVLIISALMLVGCQKSAVTGNAVVDTKPVEQTTSDSSAEDAANELPSLSQDNTEDKEYMDGDVKVFKVTAKDMKFEPYTITVKKGDKVRMIVTAEDRTYNFQLAEFHVKGTVEQGQTTTVEFVASMADAFSFFSRREWNGGKIDRLGTLVVKVQ